MKKLYTLFVALIITGSLMAQAPQSFKYQAVARDAGGDVVADQAVGMQISIIQGSISGTTVYVETFTPTTNEFGLMNLNIGAGTLLSGDFTTIDWSADTYFIKIEMDITGGTTYEEYGTSQLLSVPYALHAKTAANTFSGNYSDLSGAPINVSTFTNDAGYLTGFTEVDPIFGDWNKSTGISITEGQISDFGNYESAFTKNTAFNKNFGNSAGTVTQGNDSRLSDARTPTSHAASHTDGTDDIQDATSSQKGLMTATYATKLEGIEAGAEVNVNADWNVSSGDAQILNKPSDLTDLSGHNATELADINGDDITNLGNLSGINTGDQTLATILGENTSADGNKITELSDPTAAQDAATKAYIDQMKAEIFTQIAGGKLTDYDGNSYNIVKIGDQVWMAENLKTTKYNTGTDIPLVTDGTAWSNLTTPGYCWYDNNEATYGDTYGALYNWYTVETGNLCPAGWHVPTDAEWTTLTTYLGGESVAGGKLKETGTTHWNSPNTGATNESGFTALPGGPRGLDGSFYYVGVAGYWWSSTEYSASTAWHRHLSYDGALVDRDYGNKKYGFSVRCLRD